MRCLFLCTVLFMGGMVHAERLPNIIYILADDLGYGDLSCLGQTHFETPHIDRLAREGMLFTQHYAGAPVCAPSRCALMTGKHTGHSVIRGNSEVIPEGQAMPADTFTMAQMLKDVGYTTGLFGKWGLGLRVRLASLYRWDLIGFMGIIARGMHIIIILLFMG